MGHGRMAALPTVTRPWPRFRVVGKIDLIRSFFNSFICCGWIRAAGGRKVEII